MTEHLISRWTLNLWAIWTQSLMATKYFEQWLPDYDSISFKPHRDNAIDYVQLTSLSLNDIYIIIFVPEQQLNAVGTQLKFYQWR